MQKISIAEMTQGEQIALGIAFSIDCLVAIGTMALVKKVVDTYIPTRTPLERYGVLGLQLTGARLTGINVTKAVYETIIERHEEEADGNDSDTETDNIAEFAAFTED